MWILWWRWVVKVDFLDAWPFVGYLRSTGHSDPFGSPNWAESCRSNTRVGTILVFLLSLSTIVELTPVIRGHAQKCFQNELLHLRLLQNAVGIQIARGVTNDGRTKYFCHIRQRHLDLFNFGNSGIFNTKLITVRTFTSMRTNLWRWRMRKANVSWFGGGSSSNVRWNSACLLIGSEMSMAVAKARRNQRPTNGSRRERKKSLMQPQITWGSMLERFGTPLPRRKRSLRAFTSLSDPGMRYNPTTFKDRISISLIQCWMRAGTIGWVSGV